MIISTPTKISVRISSDIQHVSERAQWLEWNHHAKWRNVKEEKPFPLGWTESMKILIIFTLPDGYLEFECQFCRESLQKHCRIAINSRGKQYKLCFCFFNISCILECGCLNCIIYCNQGKLIPRPCTHCVHKNAWNQPILHSECVGMGIVTERKSVKKSIQMIWNRAKNSMDDK